MASRSRPRPLRYWRELGRFGQLRSPNPAMRAFGSNRVSLAIRESGGANKLPLLPSQIYDLCQGLELECVQDRAGEADLDDIGACDRRQPPGVVIHLQR